ncbi:transporter substrate-binding domain-containing protein [Magnetococcus sp. PR-3]|uniref:transporter substrate-binding domain-containing protein n=1 Tax=Magnetococcus sp. PR-3 TaxID=3120355 RepID=UPI002FCE1CB4
MIRIKQIGRWSILLWFMAQLMVPCSSLAASPTPQHDQQQGIATEQSLELTAEEQAWLANHPVIRIGSDPNFPPLDFIENDEASGLSTDFLKLIFKKLGLEVRFITDKEWKQLTEMARKKELDLLHTLMKTDEREQFLHFTVPFIRQASTSGIFTKKGSGKISGIEDLAGKRVAVVKEYFHKNILKQHYPKLKLVEFDNLKEGLVAVSMGQADALIVRKLIGDWILQQHLIPDVEAVARTGDPRLDDRHWRMGVRKDWPLFASILNKAIQSVSQAEYNQLLAKWIFHTSPQNHSQDYPIPFTPQEISYLKNQVNLTYCVDPTRMPFERINSKGQAEGLTIDLMRLMEKRLGISLRLVPTETVKQSLAFLQSGRCEILSSAARLDFQQQTRTLTQPYSAYSLVAIIRNDEAFIENPSAFGNRILGVAEGSVYRKAIKASHPTLTIQTLPSIADGLQQVADGRLFAFVDTLPSLNYTLRRQGIEGLKVGSKLDVRLNHTMAVGEQQPVELVTILNKALASISNEEKQILADKWFSIKIEKVVDFTRIWQILTAIFTLLLITLYWNRKLTRLNQTLEKANQEINRARTDAEQANRHKSEFIANMSHEIRTPLNPIIGLTHLALQSEPHERTRAYLNKIQLSTQLLLQIINDVLDFSKIEAGKLMVEKVAFSPATVLHSVSALYHEKTQEKGLNFQLHQPEWAALYLLGDPLRLEQVLSNLISNAIKFTQHGFVRITVTREESVTGLYQLNFAIADSGIGMDAQQAEEIFKAFSQADGTTTRKYGGTGLGLSISQRLVHLMGGSRIEVTSTPDQGSCFSFSLTLPTAQANEAVLPINPTSTASSWIQFNPCTVLLVEDNQLNQYLIQELLEYKGIDVEVANNGKLALDQLQQQSYDLILMDIQMPQMDGFQTTEVIRSHPQWSEIPIIALTAHAFLSDIQQCLSVGMNDHVAKPIDPTKLYETLRKWLPTFEQEEKTHNEQAPTKDTDILYGPEYGIDLDKALAAVAGHRDLLRKLQMRFHQNYQDTIPALRQQLAKHDYETMKQTLHRLKGVTGSIGANQLYQATIEMENLLLTEQTDQIETAMDTLDRHMKPILKGIARLNTASTDPLKEKERQPQALDLKQLQPMFQEMTTMLNSGRHAANRQWAMISQYLQGCGHDQAVHIIRDEIDAIEYQKALEALQQLGKALGLNMDKKVP